MATKQSFNYYCREISIEGDYSSASFFFLAGAISFSFWNIPSVINGANGCNKRRV